MAAGALHGKQRRAQPSTDDSHRLENQHENATKYPNIHKNNGSDDLTRHLGHKLRQFRLKKKGQTQRFDESP